MRPVRNVFQKISRTEQRREGGSCLPVVLSERQWKGIDGQRGGGGRACELGVLGGR